MNRITMIIGGSGSSYPYAGTELWEFEYSETKEIDARVDGYIDFGLFIVEDGFCSKKSRVS